MVASSVRRLPSLFTFFALLCLVRVALLSLRARQVLQLPRGAILFHLHGRSFYWAEMHHRNNSPLPCSLPACGDMMIHAITNSTLSRS